MQSAEYRVQANRQGASRPEFQNLVVWQMAQALAAEVVRLVDSLPASRSAGTLGNQVLRSAASVAANIAEGYGRYSEPAYRHHLSIARGSLFETESWLDLLQKASYLSGDECLRLTEACEEVARLITAVMKPLRSGQRLGEEPAEYGVDV